MEIKTTHFLFKNNKLEFYQPSLKEIKSAIAIFSRDNNDIVIQVPDGLNFDTKVEIAKAAINEDKNFHILSMLECSEVSAELVEAMLDRNTEVLNKYDYHVTIDRDDHESISRGKPLPQKDAKLWERLRKNLRPTHDMFYRHCNLPDRLEDIVDWNLVSDSDYLRTIQNTFKQVHEDLDSLVASLDETPQLTLKQQLEYIKDKSTFIVVKKEEDVDNISVRVATLMELEPEKLLNSQVVNIEAVTVPGPHQTPIPAIQITVKE